MDMNKVFWYKTSSKGKPDAWKIQVHFRCFNTYLLIIIICIFTEFYILLM